MKRRKFVQTVWAAPWVGGAWSWAAGDGGGVRLATFEADVTPELGAPLCHGNVLAAKALLTPLLARGVVLLGAGEPLVLCALDWVALANDSHEKVRELIAEAVGTSSERVAVHTVHQHDAPGSDLGTERLLVAQGLGGHFSNAAADLAFFEVVAGAAKQAMAVAQPVTHIGFGHSAVEKVASNRRVLGADGQVAFTRMSASRHPEAATAPEGTIDPLVRVVSFWQGDRVLAGLTYYATHPMSYYGQGGVNWDFVGGARAVMDAALPGVAMIHFNGAAGNITAGKYNDGNPANRAVLAQRLADGMKQAWESQRKRAITAEQVGWRVAPVTLPLRNPEAEVALLAVLADGSAPVRERARAARELVFMRRMQAGKKILVGGLKLGDAAILHLPAELFVEYQLAAQALRPEAFVAMAAYGDNGPGYIGTEIAYTQGGYEVGPVSRVSPAVERVLMEAMEGLLDELI